jgi:hypothetical protein
MPIMSIFAVSWNLYCEIEPSYKGLEFVIPLICKREVITLTEGGFFDYEKLEKLYLSKRQSKKVLNEIKNNSNWKKGEVDEIIDERLNFFSRENIYNKIPNVKNKYWIFTNRNNGVKDKHSMEELIETRLYYAISFGLFDIDNNILYYYQYDR